MPPSFTIEPSGTSEGICECCGQTSRRAYRLIDGTPRYMAVDAKRDPFTDLADRALTRTDVIGTLLAPQVFAICDAILAQDARLRALADPGALM